MRPFPVLAMLFCIGLSALGQAPDPQAAGQKPRIAVLPLRGTRAGMMEDQGDTLYQKVTAEFLRLKRFDVIERAQMGAILREGKFQNSGLVDDASAVALGKQLGVQFVILGSWNGVMTRQVDVMTDKQGRRSESISFPGSVTTSLRMVDVQTGGIKATFEAKGAPFGGGSPSDSLASMLKDLDKKLGREISNMFPLTGCILKVLNEKEAIIDLGGDDGVKIDDPFALVLAGEDIVHPKTGKVIKGEKSVLAQLKVTRVDSDKAYVRIDKLIDRSVVLKAGMDLESMPKKAGAMESFGDFFRR